MLPLSKTLDPADFAELAEELKIVDQHFTQEAEQHPMRRWEYALALRALNEWVSPLTKDTDLTGSTYDVGGAGSPFKHMLDDECVVIDPDADGGEDLATYLRGCPPLGEAVFCLSVLEHVDDLDRFCYHLGCLVAPGGLLFLTMDYCDGAGGTPDGWPADTYHFHWMRQRIFNHASLIQAVVSPLGGYGFTLMGGQDFTWHGPQVYGYTFACLALQRRA
jgi:hypothetical protein